jgi:succinate dehydrogenase / fumarate reductase cytochrome b subunit
MVPILSSIVVGERGPAGAGRGLLLSVVYVLAMAALGLHLYHGSWAVVRTLGVARPSAQPLKRRVALAIAIIVAAGFMIIPSAAVLGTFAPAPPLAESSAATALTTPVAETH